MKTLYSRYLLPVVVIMLMQPVHAQQIKAVNSKPKSILSKKKITEQEAKRINEAQLAREGKAGTRRAYKRSEMEKLLHTREDASAASAENSRAEHIVAPAPEPPKKQVPVKKTQAVIAQNTTPEPKFIEGIVLERNR